MTVILCGPADVGHDSCWWCDDPLARTVAAFGKPFTNPNGGRFCSLECALDHADQVGDGPCTVCGVTKGNHVDGQLGDRHPYLPFGTPAEEVYAATVGAQA